MSAGLESLVAPAERSTVQLGGREVLRLAPSSEAQAAEILRTAHAAGQRVLPLGSGLHAGWLAALAEKQNSDCALSTENLTGVVAYEPGDGTLTALAGTPWSTLTETCTAGGHRLSPSLPYAQSRTLGGAVASGSSGLDRLRFGPLRHQLLGTRALNAEGQAVKSGGRLVKNVTGFDLHRLQCGSYGALAFLTEVSLRLYPAPEATRVLEVRCEGWKEVERLAFACRNLPLRITWCAARKQPGVREMTLALELSGRADVIAWEAEQVTAVFGDHVAYEGPAALNAALLWQAGVKSQGQRLTLAVNARPSRIDAVWKLTMAAAEASGVQFQAQVQPTLARIELLAPEGELEPQSIAAWCAQLRSSLDRHRASLEVLHGPSALFSVFSSVAPTAAAKALMETHKRTLDPTGVFPSLRL